VLEIVPDYRIVRPHHSRDLTTTSLEYKHTFISPRGPSTKLKLTSEPDLFIIKIEITKWVVTWSNNNVAIPLDPRFNFLRAVSGRAKVQVCSNSEESSEEYEPYE